VRTLLLACLGGVATAAAVTAVCIPILTRQAVVDVPSHRSSHTRPTVRGGGIGLAAGAVATFLIIGGTTGLDARTATGFLVGGLGFGAIGLADDLSGSLPVAARLVMQVIVGALAAGILLAGGTSAWVSVGVCALGVFWLVAFVNAFNFMDGINGISCVEATVAGVAIGLVARHAHQPTLEAGGFSLAAGAVGFAPFNAPRARIFLGDVGSYFAGAWLALVVALGVRASIPPEAVIAPVLLYVADTGATLVSRIRQHEQWHQAHRQHTYQRLVDLGWSHMQAALVVLIVVVICSTLGAVSIAGTPLARAGADCAGVALVIGYLLLPRVIGRWRRSPTQVQPQAGP